MWLLDGPQVARILRWLSGSSGWLTDGYPVALRWPSGGSQVVHGFSDGFRVALWWLTDGYPVALGWPSGGSRGGSRMARKSWSFGGKEAQDFCEKEPSSERGKMAP